jgi:hypothetical protein
MPRFVHDYLRERLLRKVEAINAPPPPLTLEDLEKEIEETTWDKHFLQLMWNRLLMGRIRYGSKRRSKVVYDYSGSIKEKIALYISSGNLEYLVDIGNYAMLEFRHGKHPNRHFEANDDAEHCRVK